MSPHQCRLIPGPCMCVCSCVERDEWMNVSLRRSSLPAMNAFISLLIIPTISGTCLCRSCCVLLHSEQIWVLTEPKQGWRYVRDHSGLEGLFSVNLIRRHFRDSVFYCLKKHANVCMGQQHDAYVKTVMNICNLSIIIWKMLSTKSKSSDASKKRNVFQIIWQCKVSLYWPMLYVTLDHKTSHKGHLKKKE